MKKGFIFTMDAMIALSVMIMIVLTAAFVRFETILPEKRYEKLNYMAEDTMNLLEYLEVHEIQDTSTIKDLIESGELEKRDLNKTVLDLIASFWYKGNYSVAENISRDVLQGLTDTVCLNLTIGAETIYSSCDTPTDKVAVSTRIESGYEPGKPGYGYVAGARLTDIRGKRDSSYVYFGGYVGEGNITRILELPPYDEILEAYMEMNTNSNFTLHINGNYSGFFANGTAGGGNMTADKWVVCNDTYHPEYCLNFTEGNNTLEFNFTANDSYIGGGYFKVTYNTRQLTPEKDPNKDWYWFPGIKGFLNLYSSFYVPGTINNMTVHLHYYNNLQFGDYNVPVYVTIGEEEVYRSDEIGEQDVNLSYDDIWWKFGITPQNFVNKVSNKTVPITLGTGTLEISKGAADAILITDISGSMDACDVDSPSGPCDCHSPPPCNRRRLNVAKEVDKEFVDHILNIYGNRIGLISYSAKPGIWNSSSLTTDKNQLNEQIDSYTDEDYTCISCGIDGATNLLARNITDLISKKSTWLYNTSYPASDPPDDLNGNNWKEIGYDTNGWNSGKAILGFDNYPYGPTLDTDIGDNGGNYYFRKNFTVNISELEAAWLYVLSDDRAEIYLNGQLIDDDTVEHNASYWNRGVTVLYDSFEDYDSQCGQVDGNDLDLSPGNWTIDDAGQEIFLMCNNPSYPAHNGTDVLVFRDMDSAGYAETTLDLSGYSDVKLSFWWKIGPDGFESSDWANVSVWDGEWHSIAFYDQYDDDNIYHHAEIDLSPYKMIDNFKIRFGSGSVSGHWRWWPWPPDWVDDDNNDERFYVDDVSVKAPIPIDKSYFVDEDNVIAIKLYNDNDNSAKFDLKLIARTNEMRKKAMLVMSDGIANTILPGDCSGCAGSLAKRDAIYRACDARDEHNITVYSVAFGPSSSADEETLIQIACWNCTACVPAMSPSDPNLQNPDCWLPGESLDSCSHFYNSSNADELKKIYKKIAEEIVELGYTAQKLKITGSIPLDNIIYTDSYIEYNYTPATDSVEYGLVSVTKEGKRLRELTGDDFITDQPTKTKEGWYLIPEDVKIVDAKMTSYSSEFWTDRLLINSSATGSWIPVYNLSDEYSEYYRELGDPYIIQIPVQNISSGNNSVRIGVGSSPEEGAGGSPDDRLIYTMRIRGSVGYNETFESLEDATNDAKKRLNDTIKIYGVYVGDEDIDVDYKSYAGIRSIWGPSLLKVIIWENTTI